MEARSHFRGWPIVWVGSKKDGYWTYKDTGERLPATGGKIRPCKKCGELFTLGEGEVDPCLGVLPGVNNACCGHGIRDSSYIRFSNGKVVEGFVVYNSNKGVLWCSLPRRYNLNKGVL